MIQAEQLGVFEGKYWKPVIGGQHFLTVQEWSIEEVSFQDKPPKPKLILKIRELDGKPSDKIFQTGNRNLIVSQLGPLLLQAQTQQKKELKLLMTRNAEHDYRILVLNGGA